MLLLVLTPATPTPFLHKRHQEGTALQSRSPARGSPSSPSPTKAHPFLNEKHKACRRASFLCPHSGRTQRISQKPPGVNPVPRRVMTTSKRQTALRTSKAPGGDCARGRTRTCARRPWTRPLETWGVPNDRRRPLGACGTASAWGPGVGEATSRREDTPPRVSHIGLNSPCPHSRPRGALSPPGPKARRRLQPGLPHFAWQGRAGLSLQETSYPHPFEMGPVPPPSPQSLSATWPRGLGFASKGRGVP